MIISCCPKPKTILGGLLFSVNKAILRQSSIKIFFINLHYAILVLCLMLLIENTIFTVFQWFLTISVIITTNTTVYVPCWDVVISQLIEAISQQDTQNILFLGVINNFSATGRKKIHILLMWMLMADTNFYARVFECQPFSVCLFFFSQFFFYFLHFLLRNLIPLKCVLNT